jgi:hypothetical protein
MIGSCLVSIVRLCGVLALVGIIGTPAAARAEKGSEKRADKGERELPVPALFGRVSPSVVVIDARGKERLQGSGVVVGVGHVVTNYHVINGATSIEVRQSERRWTATAEAIDPKRDLAILAIKNFDLPRVTLRPSAALVVGERVYAVGAPRGLELTLSDGLISALRHDRMDKPDKGDKNAPPPPDGPALIQTTVPISPGSSGGGLFDAQGRLVGITTFSAVGSQNLNFAHPTEWIEALRAPKVSASAGAGGAGGALATPPPAPLYTLTQRPKTIRCRIDTRAVWGLFSGGAEMLESTPVSIDVEVYRFQGQTPAFNGSSSLGEVPYGDLVLADMSRDAGFIQFTGTPGSRGSSDYFFSIDDDGKFRLTLLRAFDFHGQLRVRASSGSCVPVEASKPKTLPTGAEAEELCERGNIDGCLTAGAAVEAKNKMSALSLYLKGCDQSRPTDKIDRARSVMKSCTEAARLCDALGYRSRAADLLEKSDTIKRRSGD